MSCTKYTDIEELKKGSIMKFTKHLGHALLILCQQETLILPRLILDGVKGCSGQDGAEECSGQDRRSQFLYMQWMHATEDMDS